MPPVSVVCFSSRPSLYHERMNVSAGNALENLMTRIVSFAALLLLLVGLSAPGQAPKVDPKIDPKTKVDPKTKTPPAKVEEPKHLTDLR